MHNQLVCKKSFFIETGTYQPPVLRTWHSNFNADVAQSYLDATDGGNRINANAISGIINNMLMPSTAPNAYVNVPHSWNTRRMSFMFEVDVIIPNGVAQESVVVTGYTEFSDNSMSGRFDPNMKVFFNTSSILATVTVRENGQIVKRRNHRDTSHILSQALHSSIPVAPPAHSGYNNPFSDSKLHYATPTVVVQTMQGNMMTDHVTHDLRNCLPTGILTRSRRDNALAPTYASRILNSVTNEFKGIDNGEYSDEHTALNQAASAVSERSMLYDPFVRTLTEQTNYQMNGFVTWGELCKIIPNLDATTIFSSRVGQVARQPQPGLTNTDPNAGDFCSWDSMSMETIHAQSIANAVPAIMTGCLLGNINFMFTNDRGGVIEPYINVFNAQAMIDGIPLSTLVDRFIYRFNNEIAPQITDFGRTIVNIGVQSNLGTETTIHISRDGQPAVPFCAPTFADVLYTPVLATNVNDVKNLATDLQSFTQSIYQAPYMR